MTDKLQQELNELRKLKIASYQDIPVVKDFICPECGKSGDGWTHVLGEGNVKLPEATLIGYCETQNSGFMEIYECPFCFKKFRYHGATTDRWNEDRFLLNMFARWKVQQHKKEHKS